MRILVTTPLGNIGRELMRLADGHVLRAAHRDRDAVASALPGAEAVRFDFLDRSTWRDAVAGCDAMFLVRPPPIADMKATLIPFIDAAYAAGLQHVVFVSVAGADRMKWVPHRKVELHLMATRRPWTILRPGFFAQNLADAYRRDIVEDGRLFVPAGRGRVAFLDALDIAAVAAKVFDRAPTFAGHTLNLTGPDAVTFDDVATMLTAVLHRPIRYEAASVAQYAYHLRRRRQMPWMQIAVQTILHVGLRRGDAEPVDPTVAKLLDRPATSLQAYLERSAATWAKR
ncbi:MAG TPA: NAD(P)H-binding protein [Kofleriaceae bacterium]|nr:NAD(P)H-binding protein [Kofleriaceae bacterium]